MGNLLTLFPLETERLIIRILAPHETELMVRFVNENKYHLASWEPRRSADYYTLPFWEDMLKQNQQDFLHGKAMRCVFFLKSHSTGAVIGVCNFNNIIRGAFQACHLGYSIDYRYQGQGLMYEALQRTIAFVFEHLKLHRIMANYMPRNERSGKLLRRLGFVPEGYARDYVKVAGKWEDHILTSLINHQE